MYIQYIYICIIIYIYIYVYIYIYILYKHTENYTTKAQSCTGKPPAAVIRDDPVVAEKTTSSSDRAQPDLPCDKKKRPNNQNNEPIDVLFPVVG